MYDIYIKSLLGSEFSLEDDGLVAGDVVLVVLMGGDIVVWRRFAVEVFDARRYRA